MYEIAVDVVRNLVEVRFNGMITLAETGDYVQSVRQAMTTKGIQAGYRMVIDIRGCPIQPQDTILAMGAHMAEMPKASRLAIVTESSLARIQMRRLFTQTYARIVGDVETGREWVLRGVEPAS